MDQHAARQPLDRRAPVLLVAAALCLLTALLLTAAPALAAGKSHGARIEILAPGEAATVGQTFDARVRVSTTAGFSASLAGHDVSKRFHRHGGVMEARLKRGRDYYLGKNTLLIAAGKGSAMRAFSVHFTSRGRDGHLLSLTRLAPRRDRTPIRFRVHVTAPVSWLKLTVNHRRLRLGAPGGRRTWTIEVGAHQGVRFGRNTLRAVAERTDARSYDRESLAFEVGRAAPLVSAGPDRRTRPGLAVGLDGGETLAGSRKGKLLYSWKIVKKPHGSHAGVVGAGGKDGSLMPDLPGTYRLRLTVARASGRAAAEATKEAKASAAIAPEPVCLPFVQLVPAGESKESEPPEPGAAKAAAVGGEEGKTGSEEAKTGEGSLDPLEAPTCVTPTGETSPPPLPASAPSAADEMEVLVSPTLTPMGPALEAIGSDGAIHIGRQAYPPTSPLGFAHLIALNKETLVVEKQETFSLAKAAELPAAILAASPSSIVIVAGMEPPETGVTPPAAEEALAKAIGMLEGRAPSNQRLGEMIDSGQWSILGIREMAGYFAANFARAAEATPVEAEIGSAIGSLNGHLQTNKSGVFHYVSTEFVPIDTRATGSSETKSVFKLGEEVLEAEIPSHSLGLHIGVFSGESASGKLTKVANLNYTLVNNGNTNGQAVEEAANELNHWRTAPTNDLIVMQTYGEEGIAPTTAPSASQYWVNDKLIPANENGLFEWNEGPYLKIKHESESEGVLDNFWNPGYQTVAGQVGDLTGPGGHDLVADFGLKNVFQENSSSPAPAEPVEVRRLTMVASNHAQTPEANYISAVGATAAGTPEGRLVGTLTRNDEGGWTVQTGSPSAAFEPSKIWEIAYAEPTAWPDSTGEFIKQMKVICEQLYGVGTKITNLRALYQDYTTEQAQTYEERVKGLVPPATETKAETETYATLRAQLIKELEYVVDVKSAMAPWESVYGNDTTNLVQVNAVTSKIVAALLEDAKKKNSAEAEINPTAIIKEVVLTSSELAGFPEVTEVAKVPQILGVLAGGIGLSMEASPEPEKSEGPETEEVRVKASEIDTALAEKVEGSKESLEHLQQIIVSDWGKLKTAGPQAQEGWTLEPKAIPLLQQSLAVNTERQLYQALLPYAYQQWVISPYVTNSNGDGPLQPGKNYQCHAWLGENGEYTKKEPFGSEPEGGLSTANYRPSQPPGSSASPAMPYTQPYTIRALKSTQDKLEMQKVEILDNQYSVDIKHDGASPSKSLVNPLFEPVRTGESLVNPTRLGINKAEFFATYGGGANDWKRAICAEN
jgi:hypothetical protein